MSRNPDLDTRENPNGIRSRPVARDPAIDGDASCAGSVPDGISVNFAAFVRERTPAKPAVILLNCRARGQPPTGPEGPGINNFVKMLRLGGWGGVVDAPVRRPEHWGIASL